MMKTRYTGLLIAMIMLFSCGSSGGKQESSLNNNSYDNTSVYYPSHDIDYPENQHDSNLVVPPPSPIDAYEEGLLDGEAAAEEDRLAGKKGMQSGDYDDEDDEYDDGYDDGYEDY